jgi:rhamnogalacturonyl hydrolase YesR
VKGALPVLAAAVCLHASAAESVADLVQRDFQVASFQYAQLLDKLKDKPGFPRTVEGGALKTVGTGDWTSGFFPGALWYLYEGTGEARWRGAATAYTAAMAPAKFDKTQHDVGFMLGSSYGNGYRLTGDPGYRDALLAGATTLVTRFDPKVGSIRSWDKWPDKDWTYPVIIDNMMNLELLTFAAHASGEEHYREVAIAHADTALRNHFRPDGSSYHVVDYDPATGRVKARFTFQGYADTYAWARGPAGGVFGFTMMYRETHKEAYLRHAQKIAGFLLSHPRLPADGVPYWDFDDPGIPNVPRDTAAAAIMSSALLELAGFSEAALAARYRDMAERQLRSLSSPAYLAAPGENGGFLLKHATGNKPAGAEIDGPLNYADYYFLEALLWLRAGRR